MRKVLGLALLVPGLLAGQEPERVSSDTVELSLATALARADREGQEVRLARAQAQAASSRVGAARSALFPQVSGTFAYTKTFASVFETAGEFTLPDSLRFSPDPDAPLTERVSYLEDMTPMAAFGALGELFSDMPFGRENLYNAGLSGQQVLYAGGRVRAGIALAENAAEVAGYQLVEQRAEIAYQVEQAYWGAVLARAFAAIAAEAVDQAEEFLVQERLRLEAGRASELDVLRAEVELENLRPDLVQARNGADLAALNLKRLVDLPLDAPLELTTPLEPGPEPAPARDPAPAAVLGSRPAVAAAERGVVMREQQVRLARSAFLPAVSLQMSYMRQAYPPGMFDLDAPWRTDWTGTVAIQLPFFNGGQRFAELEAAQAEADQARLQLAQLREGVELEYRQALSERARARAQIEARRRTVEQAERVHGLTVLRYERGLATALEVSAARLGLSSARTNLAQALADYRLAEARVVRTLGGAETAARIRSGGR